MSFPIDLSISGKPSPRIEHPRSAGNRSQTPFNVNKSRSLQSDIFASNQDEKRKVARPSSAVDVKNKREAEKGKGKTKAAVKFKQDGVSSPSVITKSALDSIRNLTERNVPEEAGQLEYGVYETSRKPAPKGVPQLSLGEITGKDDVTYTKVADEDDVASPDPDWVVPKVPKPRQQQTKGGGWQVSQSRPAAVKSPVSLRPDDVPELDLQLSQSNQALCKLRETVKQVEEDIQIEYIGKLKDEKLENLKKLSQQKKNQLFEEAILADQLSNLQVNKEAGGGAKSSFFDSNRMFDSKVKRHNDLYSSSTVTIGHEGDIHKRLQFGARILTLSGYDGRREINGFFITSDNTIAMYEFRQFGTRSKALPFIQRGAYTHLTGHRKGESFHLLDISVGNNLTFESAQQMHAPDTLKKRKHITFRITDVDEENKHMLLFEKCRTEKERRDVQDFITFYYTRENNADTVFLQQVQKDLRSKLNSSCAEKVLTNLHNKFSELDISGIGLLRKELFQEQLKKFRVSIEDEVFHKVWNMVDYDEEGVLDYGEFIRVFFGEMSEDRKLFVRKAFSRLDPNKRGAGEINDIRKYFLPSKHPSVVKGEVSEQKYLDEFVQCFKPSKHKSDISYTEFEVYYEGVSIGISSDQSFINLMRMTWNI